MGRIRVVAAIALIGFLAPASAATTDLDRLKQEYSEAEHLADKGQEDFPGINISNSPKSEAALEKEWTIAGQWVIDVLNTQTNVDNRRLSAISNQLGRSFYAQAVQLEPNVYLIEMGSGEMGTFFIVRKKEGRFELVWNVRQLTASNVARVPLVYAWTTSGARDDCRPEKPDDAWDQCGGIGAEDVGILPRDSVGRTRFYLNGQYAEIAGSTIGYQLSIWTWDGHQAVPEFAKSYLQVLDYIEAPKLVGDTVLVKIKDDFKNFGSIGASAGRQAILSVEITPSGVRNLGVKSRMPEVDAIDDLIGRIAHNKPTVGLASHSVVRALEPLVQKGKDQSYKTDPSWFSLGMIDNSESETNPANPVERLVCFLTDADNDHRIFTLERHGTGFYISKMRDIGEGDTPDKLCSKPNF